MDNKARILFGIFLLSVLFLGFFTYEKYFLNKDYTISAEIPCDPTEEICFVYHCDSAAEECSGIIEEDTSYYKKITKQAKAIPFCDPNKENCLIGDCDASDSNCIMTLCDASDPESECSSPEDFSAGGDAPEVDRQGDTPSPEEEDSSMLKE